MRVESGGIAGGMRGESHPKATPRLTQGYRKATPRLGKCGVRNAECGVEDEEKEEARMQNAEGERNSKLESRKPKRRGANGRE